MQLTRADWTRLVLLWLGGVDLRLTLLAVPPLIPLIHRELNLDEKAVGALVSLPVVLFALAAVPGSLLIARLGVRRALAVGLAAAAVFGALRGTRIILATAVLSNGMLCGETIPTIFTTPFGVLPLAGGDWRWALASWSVIVGASALGLVAVAPRHRPSLSMPRRWWPSWRENQVVRIGAVMGMASAVYFGTNAYIPDFLDQSGRHNLITPTLAVLNGSQLLTAPAVAMWDRLLMGRAGFVGSAFLMAVAQVGLVLTPGAGVVAWAFVLGFSAALSFIVVLSLPPRVAAPGDVHRMSAAVLTIQYAMGFVLPLVAGAVWDATSVAALAFVPGVLGALAMGWLALPLRISPADSYGKTPAL